MASPSAGLSRDASAPPPVAAGTSHNAASVDTTQLDSLVEKALTAGDSGRYALAAGFYRRAVDEALRLHGDTFVCTYLTLRRALSLRCQSRLQGVAQEEKAALSAEAWALASSCLPLIVRRMDANTMMPGRGTAVELAFFKRYTATTCVTFDAPPWSTRKLQLAGLSLGYATAVFSADVLLGLVCLRHDSEAQTFVLRVVDCMLQATRSLTDVWLGEEMRRERGLLDASEMIEKLREEGEARWRADVAQHGLKHCALPSCDKPEVSVQQYKFCSACRSVWYCSAEHGALHWAEHKPICRATTAAQQAADDAGAGAA